MGLTVTRTGPSLEEQFYRGLLDKALADCAARSPPGADVVVRIPLAGGHELRIEGAPDPTSWSVRVRVTDAGTVVEEGPGKPSPSVLMRWTQRGMTKRSHRMTM